MKQPIEYILPAYWASYLVNGDDSGLDEGDLAKCDAWLVKENPGVCVSVSEDTWFARTNDASNLGGDVATFAFIPHAPWPNSKN